MNKNEVYLRMQSTQQHKPALESRVRQVVRAFVLASTNVAQNDSLTLHYMWVEFVGFPLRLSPLMKLISCDSVGFEVSSNIKASMFGLIRCDFNKVEKFI